MCTTYSTLKMIFEYFQNIFNEHYRDYVIKTYFELKRSKYDYVFKKKDFGHFNNDYHCLGRVSFFLFFYWFHICCVKIVIIYHEYFQNKRISWQDYIIFKEVIINYDV